MAEAVSYVTQSKYFSPAFNAAIFDGPIRIYFAQYQEAQALKIYFNLQQRFQSLHQTARDTFRERKQNIFVMLYPNEETFDLSFLESPVPEVPLIAEERFGRDFVLGVRGPLEDAQYDNLYSRMEMILHTAQTV